MAKKQPTKHKNQVLKRKSITFFHENLPNEWNVKTIDRDYGKELQIEITENGDYKGLEFIVQLKSSYNPDQKKDKERQKFKVSTYNYLRNNLIVVLIVKFIESENEAYWILLKDIPEPNQDNERFTIKLSRQNTLSSINWNGIANYVRNIKHKNLKAVTANE